MKIRIDERDRDKTAFNSPYGLYRFIRMSFGLNNAPATFQMAIGVILDSVKWKFALVYIYYVVVFSNTEEDHNVHVRSVLTLLRNEGVSLKLKKFFLFHNKIEYLGHFIIPGSSEVAPQVTDAIQKFHAPTTVIES